MKNEIEVMRVFRVPPRGALVVEVNGRRYENISEIESPQWQQVVMTAVGELVQFTGGYQTLVDAGVAAPIMPAPEPKSARLMAEQNQTPAETRQQIPSQAGTNQESLSNLVSTTSKTLPTAATSTPSESLPLLEQIDRVLQKHLQADPALANRSIFLTAQPEGGVNINIDGKIYNNPLDIEDNRIKLALKMALQEWESS